MKQIEMHLHSFSLRYQFRYRHDFSVQQFIEVAAKYGFTGVNISANGPGYRDLGGQSERHFAAVKASLAAHNLGCELDTSDTRPAHMRQLLDVTAAVGGDTLRVYTRYQGETTALIEQTVADLAAIASYAADRGIVVALENHEDFQGAAIAAILERVAHPNVRALFDYGNSQMVGEDPVVALTAMAPYVRSVHIKDHVVLCHQGQLWVQGVPMGTGRLPILQLTEKLYEAGLRRFCFENVWAYVAPVIVPADELPATECFALSDTNAYLWGDDMPPADALEAEWSAFLQGWQWLQAQLQTAGYVITRNAAR